MNILLPLLISLTLFASDYPDYYTSAKFTDDSTEISASTLEYESNTEVAYTTINLDTGEVSTTVITKD